MIFKKNSIDLTLKRLMYVLAVMGALAVIFVSIFIITGPRSGLIKSDSVSSVKNEDILNSKYTLKESADYGDSYIDKIYFLGDYTIKKMLDMGLLKDSGGKTSYQIWTGENGDIPLDSSIKDISVRLPEDDSIRKLSDIVTERSPEYIIITLGISNGVPYCNKEKFMQYYNDVIDVLEEASPNTNIILQSIFPISKKVEKASNSLTQKQIDKANEWILELCKENDLKFLYSAECLTSQSGYLIDDYVADDGSMNQAGYKKVIKYIQTHSYQ